LQVSWQRATRPKRSEGVNFAVLIGGWPRKEGMQRKDLIAKNVPIYQSQASALQQHAAPNCKVQSSK
jgi:malate dehydrogenase